MLLLLGPRGRCRVGSHIRGSILGVMHGPLNFVLSAVGSGRRLSAQL